MYITTICIVAVVVVVLGMISLDIRSRRLQMAFAGIGARMLQSSTTAHRFYSELSFFLSFQGKKARVLCFVCCVLSFLS